MKIILANCLLFATLASTQALAQSAPGAPASDNTKSNAAPANSSINTSIADGQSNLATDLHITQQIRKSVIRDKHLSTYAHNVKIVSVNGAVTLNGVVKSEHERNVVEMKAQSIAGKDKVTNELTISPKG